jgi:zona occludens toxin
MIYLITGVPGSGKTLYAVSTLVQKLASETLKKRGKEIQRRVIVDGIPDLVIPHERMAEVDDETMTGEGDSILNWPHWCKPGDILVIDEVQRYWRPRGMGTKPPEMIKALETHRHLGIDFVLITQNPMLIDQNVRRLVGRHQHIRRLFGMQRAVIYDWDGCSVDVHRTKSATVTMWGYPKSAYALYKSSELHTKQRQKIPPWIVVPVLGLVLGIAVAPTAFSTMKGVATGKGVPSSLQASKDQTASTPLPAASAPLLPASGASPEPDEPASPPPKVELSGCVYRPDAGCRCYTATGKKVEAEPDMCADLAAAQKPLAVGLLPADTVPDADTAARLFTSDQ